MFYSNEIDESDLEVFHIPLQTKLQESLIIEIQEKCAIKWYMR